MSEEDAGTWRQGEAERWISTEISLESSEWGVGSREWGVGSGVERLSFFAVCAAHGGLAPPPNHPMPWGTEGVNDHREH